MPAVWLAFPAVSRRHSGWLLAALALVVGLKLAAGAVDSPVGLVARYWVGTSPTGPAERSTDFRWLTGATRVDRAIDFHGNQFPVHFFDDAARFNLPADARPSRDQLPFFVRWDGDLLVPSDGQHLFRLESVGPARLWLDDVQAVSTGPVEGVQTAEARVPLASGLHHLRVEYGRPEARVPHVQLQWEERPGGPLQVVAAPAVFRERPAGENPTWQASLATSLGAIADALLVAALLGWALAGLGTLRHRPPAAWRRAALALLPLLFLGYGLALYAPVDGRTTILSGLDDWLTHESSARDILLNGPLMTGGRASGPPYYAQPLYPYALALAHALAGEGLSGVLVLQMASLGVVLAMAGLLGSRLFGWTGGAAALGFFWAFLQQEHLRVARQLLNENLYMPLVVAALLVLVALVRRRQPPPWWQTLLAGVLLGVTAIARSQFLLFVPFAFLVLWLAWRRQPAARWRSFLAISVLIVGMLAAIAPVTARNVVVSRRLVFITSSAGQNLLGDHGPPRGFDLGDVDSNPVYEALRLDHETRTVVEYARRDPGGYLLTWLVNGTYSIGWTTFRRSDGSVYWGFLVTFATYVAAFLLPRARRLEVWLLHAFVATHLLVMMAFEADTYGFRLVVPMYVVAAVVAAQAPLAAVTWGLERVRFLNVVSRRWASGALVGAVVLGAAVQQTRGLLDLWPRRELIYHGLAGPVADAATAADRGGADLVYVASIDGTPRRYGAGNLPGLRYPPFKWFDPSRSVPLAPTGARAAYLLAEIAGPRWPAAAGVASCLGDPGPGAVDVLSADEASRRCVVSAAGWQPVDAQFDALAKVDAVAVTSHAEVGEPVDALLLWRPLQRPREPEQTFLHLVDDEGVDRGTVWGNATAQLYPADQWEAGERLLSRLVVQTDPTAPPGTYPLSLGFSPARPNAPPLTARWPGGTGDRVQVASVDLAPATVAREPSSLPEGMRLLASRPSGGGLELLAVRTPSRPMRPGERIRLSLLWRALRDGPSAAKVRLQLIRSDGQVVHEVVRPLLGGRASPGVLRSGALVRDEQSLLLPSRTPSEPLELQFELLDQQGRLISNRAFDAGNRLGTVVVEGRQRSFDAPSNPGVHQTAVFARRVELLGYRLDPARARPGESFTLKLSWRALADMDLSYTVFVHVLDGSRTDVLAQRDGEPQDGKAPTSGWLPDEVVSDEYRVFLPAEIPPGEYPVEVGLYDQSSGARLSLPNGDTRLILDQPLHVVP